MSITKVQSNGGFDFSSAPVVAFTSNVTAGNLLLAAVTTGGGGTVTTAVTDSQGNTYHLLAGTGTGYVTTGSTRVSLHAATAGSSGACTVTATPSSGGAALAVLEYSGTNDGGFTQDGQNTGSDSPADCGSVTPAVSGSLVVGAVGLGPQMVYSEAGANGYTLEAFANNTAVAIYVVDKFGVGASPDTPTFTFGDTASWAGRGAAFSPTGGGGGGSAPPARVIFARRTEQPTDPMFSE